MVATILLILSSPGLFPPAVVAGDQEPPKQKPWYDARLREFFSAKSSQARAIADADKVKVSDDVWHYFDAGKRGDWTAATNLWQEVRQHSGQHARSRSEHDENLDAVWPLIAETYMAWEQFAGWKEKYVLAFGNDIIKSIPAGSIYFGGTDPGRGLITAMCEAHAEGKPFFTITQNQLAESHYLDYVRFIYSKSLHLPDTNDSASCFSNYYSDARARFEHDQRYPGEPKQIRPGEDITVDSAKGTISVGGNTAVMAVNGLIAKVIFDRNSAREFFVEESFPLDWMYPHLSPNGLIMKLNRQPLSELTEDMIKQDRAYWSRYLKPILGDWLKDDTTVAEVAAFAVKVNLKRDFRGFKGDPEFIRDSMAQKAFSKLRSSIAASIYDWRYRNAKTPTERERMLKEADFAYRQSVALCPYSPEAVFHYVKLLADTGRFDDALLVAEACQTNDPTQASVANLVDQLRAVKQRTNPVSLEQMEKEFHDDPSKIQLGTYLLSVFRQTPLVEKADALAEQLLDSSAADAAAITYVAQYFAEKNNYRELEKALELLTKRKPDSPEAWFDLAGVQVLIPGKKDQAPGSLKRALEENTKRLGRDDKATDITDNIRKDTRFAELLKTPEFQNLLPPK